MDKVALVTGAATGLGAAISVALARAGADVVISDKPGNSTAETAAAARAFERRILQLHLDVRDLSQISNAVDELQNPRIFGILHEPTADLTLL